MNEHDTSAGEDANPEKQEIKPARVARDHKKFSIHRTKTTKALYGAAGGIAALGGGAIVQQFTQPPPTQPGIAYKQDLDESTRHAPGTISAEDLKKEMQAALEAIESDPVAAQRFEAELNGASLHGAVLQGVREFCGSEYLDAEPQATELRAFTVDAARTHIADEVRQAPLALDLSVEAASAFAAGLLLDILKEARKRIVGKVVDAIFKGHLGGQQPDTATQAAPADAAAGVSAADAETQDLANELAGYLRRLREQDFRETAGTVTQKHVGASTAPEHAESEYRVARRILAEALDGAQQALADQLLECQPKFRPPPVKRRNAERIAATTRIQAANLITRAETYGTSSEPG